MEGRFPLGISSSGQRAHSSSSAARQDIQSHEHDVRRATPIFGHRSATIASFLVCLEPLATQPRQAPLHGDEEGTQPWQSSHSTGNKGGVG